MNRSAIDLGPAELATRGGLSTLRVDRCFAPRNTAEAKAAFGELAGAGAVAVVGAQRSFEGHFLPPGEGGVALSSERLKGPVSVLGKSPDGVLTVRASAGTTFGELLSSLHEHGLEVMPFSCPTSEAISLGGALGANTHGRTTDTYGGFFADHVTGFRLSCPNGAVYDCSERASGQLERRLFRHVPGAFGALGLVTEMELELCPISPRTSVVMQVLSEHTGDPLAAVESYERHVENNRVGDTFRFSEGVGLVCFGEPRTGKAVVVARNRSPHDVAGTTLPLFDGRGTRNALLQLLVHRFPAPVQWLTPRLLRSGRRYTSSYYNWAFFQSSHDHAGEVFARASPAVRTLGRWLGVDPRLTLVHVGWVVPRAALVPFMRRYFELLDSPAHQAIAPHLELQDVLPLPTCRWPLNPSYRHERGSHVLTWSCRVLHRRADLLNQAIGFCRELSSSVRDLGAVVQLIKQIHVDDDVLRDMHQGAIDALAEIKREVDPQGLLRSRTLDRLGVTPI